jgi:3-deoxy-D-manno-octulosonic-acid transferase
VGKRFASGTPAHLGYNVALGGALLAAAPAWVPYVLAAGKRRRTLRDRLGMRMAGIPAPSGRTRVWVHAVSVGETLSVSALAQRLRCQDPSLEVLLSTVTATGQEAAAKTLDSQIDGRFYFPFDLPGICGRFLSRIRPDLVAIIETEIWPNFLAACARRDIPAVILNGRISDRSFRRYKRLKFLFGRVLDGLTAVAAQTEEDARRFREIGADPRIVTATGNMKFDIAPPPEGDTPLRAWMKEEKRKGGTWFVAGSTHEGEDLPVLRAFARARAVNGDVRLLIAPRHPERFSAVEELCSREGWRVGRKTALARFGEDSPPILLLDTVGELPTAYAAADVAFVGGSLAPKGGHNILEPALYGVPVIVGPHMENFRDIARLFGDAGAMIRVEDGNGLSERLARWAEDPAEDAATGRRARELLDAFRGAADRNAAIVLRELSRRGGHER